MSKPEEKSVFTYVGKGEDVPSVINFMGRQKFVRGEAVEVSDPDVLAKIVTHPCFVQGSVKQENLFAADVKAKAEAEKQRNTDKETNKNFHKKHKPSE